MARKLNCSALLACLAAFCSWPALADTTYVVGSRNGSVRDLLGINIGPLPAASNSNADLSAIYRQLGIKQIRTHDYYGPLDMATLYPDRSLDPALSTSYNFTGVASSEGRSSDTVFASIVNNGFEPFFRLGDSYNNARPPTDSQLNNWVAATVNVLKHYRQGQWNGFTSDFRYVEIWNEADNTTFWPSPFTRTQYLTLYDTTAQALRAAFPELKIGGPGFTQRGCTTESGKAQTRSFLDYVKGKNSPLDYFSWHIYSNTPEDIVACAAYYRQELDSRGYQSVPTFLTEWNTDAERPEQTQADKLALRTMGKGAALLTGAWIGLQNRDDVAQTHFYRGPDPGMEAPTFYGIYYANGTPKLIGLAWQLWEKISRYPHRLAASGSASGLYLLAGENDAGARSLLIANTGTATANWTSSFADGKTLADYQITTHTVSDASSAIVTTYPTATTSFAIPAEAVQLIQLTPRSQTFAASATTAGSTAHFSLGVDLSIAAADIGRSGNIYLAALAGSDLYLFDGTHWRLWSGGPLPVWHAISLTPTMTLPVLQNIDTASLAGIQVIVGYGLNEADMLVNGKFALVHTFR